MALTAVLAARGGPQRKPPVATWVPARPCHRWHRPDRTLRASTLRTQCQACRAAPLLAARLLAQGWHAGVRSTLQLESRKGHHRKLGSLPEVTLPGSGGAGLGPSSRQPDPTVPPVLSSPGPANSASGVPTGPHRSREGCRRGAGVMQPAPASAGTLAPPGVTSQFCSRRAS